MGNRMLLIELVSESLAAGSARTVGLAFIDLDLFKVVNDRHGHVVGDEVLIEVGRRLLFAGPSGTPIRIGGDEFALPFPTPTPTIRSSPRASKKR
ncbi:MAG: GGDEF domain-containing protein [Acidimicrobiales bacterium]